MEEKMKHLEMIQGVINRMASNSFMLKGWAVTLVAGIFALVGNDNENIYNIIAYIPIIVFWGLDSFYLLQERLYRGLYEKVRLLDNSDIDFSMKATEAEFGSEVNNLFSCIISETELYFYFPLAIFCTIIIIFS
ncbi:hypothetical protein [Huintestinicola sp.]|mgnify:FL=1